MGLGVSQTTNMKKDYIYIFEDKESKNQFIGFSVKKDIFFQGDVHSVDYMLFSLDSSYNKGIEKLFKKVSKYCVKKKEMPLMDFYEEYKKELLIIENKNLENNLFLNWMDKNQMAFALKNKTIKEEDITKISSSDLLSFSYLT